MKKQKEKAKVTAKKPQPPANKGKKLTPADLKKIKGGLVMGCFELTGTR